MKLGFFLLFMVLALTGASQPSLNQQLMEYQKVIANAQDVSAVIHSLSFRGKESQPRLKFSDFEPIKIRIDQLLNDLHHADVGFKLNYLPIELDLTAINREQIKTIVEQLSTAIEEARAMGQAKSDEVAPQQIMSAIRLTVSNASDLYSSINDPSNSYDLKDHVLKEENEVLTLQDMEFSEFSAAHDPSLWDLSLHSPNLKVLKLFSTDLTDQELAALSLDRLVGLKALGLSGNNLTELPDYFSRMTSLEYLDLGINLISVFPNDLSGLKNLKYLNLEENNLSEAEQQRITKGLPTTEIEF